MSWGRIGNNLEFPSRINNKARPGLDNNAVAIILDSDSRVVRGNILFLFLILNFKHLLFAENMKLYVAIILLGMLAVATQGLPFGWWGSTSTTTHQPRGPGHPLPVIQKHVTTTTTVTHTGPRAPFAPHSPIRHHPTPPHPHPGPHPVPHPLPHHPPGPGIHVHGTHGQMGMG